MDSNHYGEFADFYRTGHYVRFAENMADRFERTLRLFDADAERVLDVACGEGTFATSIAEREFDVTGIDLSERMVELARERADETDVDVDFRVMDARNFEIEGTFDVATCWFDSINHILDIEGVADAFERIHAALDTGGTFVFDVLTIRALAGFEAPYELTYADASSAVVRDEDRRFETYTDVRFDYERNVVTFDITGFSKDGDRWRRFDETHRERGYRLEEIEHRLRTAGFTGITKTESLEEIEAPDGSADRVYFAARKG